MNYNIKLINLYTAEMMEWDWLKWNTWTQYNTKEEKTKNQIKENQLIEIKDMKKDRTKQ